MNSRMKAMVAVMVVGLAVAAQLGVASAEPIALKKLSAEWVQWFLSIPPASNPGLGDYLAGEKCMVGQRGATWFLAGAFGGGTASRTCSIPEGTKLFFPIANYFEFNSPGVCGSVAVTVAEMRANGAAFVNDLISVSLEVNGHPQNTRRVRSTVYEVALPEDNLFDALCDPANVPAGVYSPAIADGRYALLEPLPVGVHAIHFTAQAQGGFSTDVTYTIEVVPVDLH